MIVSSSDKVLQEYPMWMVHDYKFQWQSTANSVDPDQLASEEANWFESALFAIKYVNSYQQSGSSNLIGWKLEVGVAF